MSERLTNKNSRFTVKAIVSAVIFTLTYSPVLGGFTGTVATAQATQNTTSNYEYDALGNQTKITDPLGNSTSTSYDPLSRPVQLQQPAPVTGGNRPVINYSYDGLGQLQTVTDPRSLVTTYTTDGLGNQTNLASPDTGSTSRTYDAGGNVLTSIDARGKTNTYSYDALNRVTKISYASGTATQFEYDGGSAGAPNAKGYLTKMTDGSGQTTYSYGNFSRLQTKTQTIGSGASAQSATVSYTYGTSGNTNGKLTSTTYPSGNRINYGYDAAGRVNSLTLNPTNPTGGGTNTGSSIPLLTNIGYQAFGAVNSWTWGNSTSTNNNTYARGIDLDGRVTSYPLGNAVNNGIMRTVTYDAASRVTATSHSGIVDSNLPQPANYNQGYGYDNLDRLTAVTASNNQSYQYDANGNRTQATFGSTSYTNTIAANSNQIIATTGPSPAKINSYDAAGNLLSDGTVTYTYSDRGRLVTTNTSGNTVTYALNGLDQRIQKNGPTTIIPTGSNSYVYDEAGHLIGEYDANQQVIEETVFLGNLPVAVLKQTTTGTAPSLTTVTNIYYVYADHINTPRVITQATDNQIVWRWDSTDPFGLQQPDENPSNLGAFTYNQRFPGQLYDRETNTHYNYFRDYDPQLGRYVQSDPIGLSGGSFSTYAYVNGDPIGRSDPLGLFDSTNVSTSLQRILKASAAEDVAAAARLARVGLLGPVGVAIATLCTPSNAGQDKAACSDDPFHERKECQDDCDEQWRKARLVCRGLIYEQLEQRAGRRKKRSVTGVTGGYTDVEECARGLVSEQCGGNKVER